MDNKVLMAWSAFLSLAMYAGMTNIAKFADHPSRPEGWIDSRLKHAEQITASMKSKGESASAQDREAYFWSLMESLKRQEAHDAAAALPPARPQATGYDAAYARRLERLAIAELMHDCAPDMLQTLRHLYEYERAHLHRSDKRLRRHYNNLGLACFLVGQSSPEDARRYDLLKESEQWYRKAETTLPDGTRLNELSLKENKLMLAEAQNDRNAADDCRRRIDTLIGEIGGPVPPVKL